MQSEEFGRLVADAIDKKRGMLRDIDEKRGLRNAVGRLVGKRLAGVRGLDSRQVQLVIEGQRHLDHEMVQAFIDVLDLDSDEAWVASTLSRPGVTAEHLRLLRQLDDADDEQAVRAVKRHRSAKRGPTPIESGVDHKSPLSGPYAISAAYRVARTRPSLMAA